MNVERRLFLRVLCDVYAAAVERIVTEVETIWSTRGRPQNVVASI